MISGWLALIGSVAVCMIGAKVVRHFEDRLAEMEAETKKETENRK